MSSRKTTPGAWKPGQSGNPAGRPKGARHKATLAALKLMEGQADAITQTCIDAALAGDMTAIRLVLDRLVPPAKERPVSLELPDAKDAAGIAEAQTAILQAVAAGQLTPGEGTAMAGLVEARRRAVETLELETRITALENRK